MLPGRSSTVAEVPQAPSAGENASLEAILSRLGEVVEALEKGDLTLEDSLKTFEEGVKLTREGQRRLDSAEARIESLLAPESPQGEPRLQVVPLPRP
jgi:exodeoxyribonuclease VII small subunit